MDNGDVRASKAVAWYQKVRCIEAKLLTVVIPTHRRPHYLPRAIESALQAAPENEIEVIVVPNGPDESWKAIAEQFKQDPRVKWSPTSRSNANTARNHGFRLAKGKYVRFLDDDDELLSEGAQSQLHLISTTGAEACSGTIVSIDENSGVSQEIRYSEEADFFALLLSENRCQPTAHIFLHSALADAPWDESIDTQQDVEWMYRIFASKEWEWVPISEVVGRWHSHNGTRTSGSISYHLSEKNVASYLIRNLGVLKSRHAFSEERKIAAINQLWAYAHQHFYRSPLFWSKVALFARREATDSRPPDPMFSLPIIRHVHPLLIEWLMVPKRWGNRLLRPR